MFAADLCDSKVDAGRCSRDEGCFAAFEDRVRSHCRSGKALFDEGFRRMDRASSVSVLSMPALPRRYGRTDLMGKVAWVVGYMYQEDRPMTSVNFCVG